MVNDFTCLNENVFKVHFGPFDVMIMIRGKDYHMAQAIQQFEEL